MTRYCYYYDYYYYERICLLAQHAESSTDHLGLSRGCLDLDSRHAKKGSQSPLGQRCLTHPIHPGHVALSIEKPHSDVFILKWPKSFFIPRRTDSLQKKTNPIQFIESFHCDSILFCPKESTPSRPPTLFDWCHFGEVRIPWIYHMHVFSIRNKVYGYRSSPCVRWRAPKFGVGVEWTCCRLQYTHS